MIMIGVFEWKLFIPPIFGIAFSAYLIKWTWEKVCKLEENVSKQYKIIPLQAITSQ